MTPLDRLVDRYCALWSSPAPADPTAQLHAVLADGATYTDPTVAATLTRAELLGHIGKVVAARPGAVLRRTSAVDAHHGLARFSFAVVAADGTLLRDGTDFLRLDPGGSRIAEVVGFFGPLKSESAGA